MKRIHPNKVVLLVLAAFSLILSYFLPFTTSHYYRQVQTAQTMHIFMEEGWHVATPQIRFAGKPGYSVLELPVYQVLGAVVSTLSGFPAEKVGRFLNLFLALALAWGMATLALALTSVHDSRLRLSLALLSFSLPLVYGLSMWVSPDLFCMASMTWATVFLVRILQSTEKVSLSNAAWFFVLTFFSVAVKPGASLAIAPLYMLLLSQKLRANSKRLAVISALGFIAVALAMSWFVYGDHFNKTHGGTFGISGNTQHYFGLELNIAFLARMMGRIGLYVLGPGFLLWALYCVLRGKHLKGQVFRERLFLAISAFLGAAAYILVFSHLNFIHNYYQLPALVALVLGLFILLPVPALLDTRSGFAVLLIAVVLNVSVALLFLVRPDRDLAQWGQKLSGQFQRGPAAKELIVVTNEMNYLPLASFYLHRYLRYQDIFDETALKAALSAGSPVVFCKTSAADGCMEKALKLFPRCHSEAWSIGEHWVCGAHGI